FISYPIGEDNTSNYPTLSFTLLAALMRKPLTCFIFRILRRPLLEEAEKSIIREVDKKRLAPLLDTLRMTPEPNQESEKETVSEALTNILSDNAMRD
ncbi:MAG: hypothetical protein ACYCQL_08525, partial [Acidithiobacillus sp.]